MSWQSSERTFKEKISYLMTSKKLCDVTLVVGRKPKEKPFQAHRLILGMCSEVFEAMFYGGLAEKGDTVSFPDDDPDIFEMLLKCIYSEEEEVESVENALKVYHLADKYLMPELKSKCVNFLIKEISSESVIKIFELATEFLEDKLRVECWKFITANTAQVLQEDNFVNSKFSTVHSIISKDDLNVGKEIIIYNAIVNWSKEMCKVEGKEINPKNVREKIEPLLAQVRFLTMGAEEFLRGPGNDDVFTESEKFSIIRRIILKNSADPPKIGSAEKSKRFYGYPIRYASNEFRQISVINSFPSIRQKSDPFIEDLYVYGVIFYLSETSKRFTLPTINRCTLAIRNSSRNLEKRKTFNEFQSFEENCKLELDEPVFIAKSEKCEIRLEGESSEIKDLYYCSGDCEFHCAFLRSYFHFHEVLIHCI